MNQSPEKPVTQTKIDGVPVSRQRRQSSLMGRFETRLPYVLLAAVCLFCQGFLVTNDGTIWDSWYVYSWLKTHNWAPMYDFLSSVGMPSFAWLYWPFGSAPDIVGAFMWATFLCFLANGILTYQLGLRLTDLTRGEVLAISLLAQALPFFTAAQDFIMFFFVFTHTLFLLSALLIASAIRTSGGRQGWLRLIGVLGFFLSFSNAALLVYYGGFYLLFFFSYRRLNRLSLLPAAFRFIRRYPELLILPPVTWYARSILTPQHGYYEHYNEPQLSQVPANLETFFRNVPTYTFRTCTAWVSAHPVIVAVLIIAAALWAVLGPSSWRFRRSSLSVFHFLWFGALLLLLAVVPFAAAGKSFWRVPIGELSRHCILTPLPGAILLFAVLRLGFAWQVNATSRLMGPIVACLVIVLGAQYFPVYLNERVEWIFSRSFLYNAARNDEVGRSSVVVVKGYILAKQTVYGLYAFKTAFGRMDRFVTNRLPANGPIFTPSEIEGMLRATTVLPSEFTQINREGRQIFVEADRNRGDATDWQIVTRYLRLRYSRDRKKFETFLSSLCTLRTSILQPSPQATS
jgi:hypothetical protein